MTGRPSAVTPSESAVARPVRLSRRLAPEREAELYSAVLDLLREGGYEGLTMDAITARTRCSKATLYRQWTGKPEIVAMALRHNKEAGLGDIDSGSLRGDLHTMVERMGTGQLERDTALMRGLIQAVHVHPDLLQALRELLIDPELTGLETLLRRAVERGEVRAACPALEFVPHILVGALIAHPLIDDQPVGPSFLGRYIDAVVLPALGL